VGQRPLLERLGELGALRIAQSARTPQAGGTLEPRHALLLDALAPSVHRSAAHPYASRHFGRLEPALQQPCRPSPTSLQPFASLFLSLALAHRHLAVHVDTASWTARAQESCYSFTKVSIVERARSVVAEERPRLPERFAFGLRRRLVGEERDVPLGRVVTVLPAELGEERQVVLALEVRGAARVPVAELARGRVRRAGRSSCDFLPASPVRSRERRGSGERVPSSRSAPQRYSGAVSAISAIRQVVPGASFPPNEYPQAISPSPSRSGAQPPTDPHRNEPCRP